MVEVRRSSPQGDAIVVGSRRSRRSMCSCGSGSEPRGHGMGKRETADGNPRTQLATCKLEEEWSELLDHDDRCGSDDQLARMIYVWKVEYWTEKEETWLIV